MGESAASGQRCQSPTKRLGLPLGNKLLLLGRGKALESALAIPPAKFEIWRKKKEG